MAVSRDNRNNTYISSIPYSSHTNHRISSTFQNKNVTKSVGKNKNEKDLTTPGWECLCVCGGGV